MTYPLDQSGWETQIFLGGDVIKPYFDGMIRALPTIAEYMLYGVLAFAGFAFVVKMLRAATV